MTALEKSHSGVRVGVGAERNNCFNIKEKITAEMQGTKKER